VVAGWPGAAATERTRTVIAAADASSSSSSVFGDVAVKRFADIRERNQLQSRAPPATKATLQKAGTEAIASPGPLASPFSVSYDRSRRAAHVTPDCNKKVTYSLHRPIPLHNRSASYSARSCIACREYLHCAQSRAIIHSRALHGFVAAFTFGINAVLQVFYYAWFHNGLL
jgi:hypothetical protein